MNELLSRQEEAAFRLQNAIEAIDEAMEHVDGFFEGLYNETKESMDDEQLLAMLMYDLETARSSATQLRESVLDAEVPE